MTCVSRCLSLIIIGKDKEIYLVKYRIHASMAALALIVPSVSGAQVTADEKNTIDVFKRAAPAIVHVKTIRAATLSSGRVAAGEGAGTGFVFDTEGHILTNYHVIENSTDIRLLMEGGRTVPATLIGTAPLLDIAVLMPEIGSLDGTPLKPLPFGDSDALEVGQKVLAIGNPFGLHNTLTVGVLSGVARDLPGSSPELEQVFLQTDAAINPGNSGGPLLDSAGRLIGVNTAIQSPSGASAGIGFAVPVDTVNRVVPQLIARGRLERPDLGFEPVAPHLVERVFGPQKGVMVGKVFRGSAAARAGLQGVGTEGRRVSAGDLVQGVNGRPVEDWDGLLDAVEALPLGGTADLDIQREGRRMRVAIRLEAGRE